MKIKLILFVLFFTVPSFSYAQDEVTVEEKAAISRLLEMTGAIDIGLTLSESMVQQMTDLLRQTDPDIPERAFTILEEEVNAIIREETGALYEMLYPIYARHLTLSEVNGLISFYETPLGSKVVSTLPLIVQESMLAGQQWGEFLAANLGPRLMKRFEEAGIEFEK